VPFPYPRDLADEWIGSTTERIAQGEAYHLAIARREDDVLVGCVGLTLDAAARSAELGYWVGRRHWGQGIAPEAAGRLSRWALANLNIDRLTASALTDNARSAAVLTRIGFRETGEGAQDFLSRGGAMPVRLFEAGRADFAPPQPAPAVTAEAVPDGKPILLVAAVGLIDSDNRVLLARRPEGKPLAGLWEFPGGKFDAGERPEQCLIRELAEELGIRVKEDCLAPLTFASYAYPDFHLLMPLWICRRWEGVVQPLEGQALKWVRPRELRNYPMPPADEPLIPALIDVVG